MRIKAIAYAASCLAVMMSGQALAGTFEKIPTGVVVKPDGGAAQEVRLELMSDNIIHVVKLDKSGKALTPSLMTVAAPVSGNFSVVASGKDKVTLKAKRISAAVSLATGQVEFFNAAGKAFLSQASEAMAPVDVDGKPTIWGRVEEGRYDKSGKWIMERNWNGDQTDYGLNLTGNPLVLKVTVGTY